MDMSSVLCYNRGCGSKFNPQDNPDGNFKTFNILALIAAFEGSVVAVAV